MMVPKVNIMFDPRFDLETNWKVVEEVIKECQGYGVITTPLTVFDPNDGKIIGWFMEGWKSPPPKIIYESDRQAPMYISDYSI
jgi:hypothetical protein